MSDIYRLKWPGLMEQPISIVDPDTKILYNQMIPLPANLHYLNTIEYKYLNFSTLIMNFNSNQRQAARKVSFIGDVSLFFKMNFLIICCGKLL